jgi:hypothetical protein
MGSPALDNLIPNSKDKALFAFQGIVGKQAASCLAMYWQEMSAERACAEKAATESAPALRRHPLRRSALRRRPLRRPAPRRQPLRRPALRKESVPRACLAEALPDGYSDKHCKGSGHKAGKGSFKPEHGKCIVKACTNKSMHLTKDSAECMKAVHKVIALGKAEFIARGKD